MESLSQCSRVQLEDLATELRRELELQQANRMSLDLTRVATGNSERAQAARERARCGCCERRLLPGDTPHACKTLAFAMPALERVGPSGEAAASRTVAVLQQGRETRAGRAGRYWL